MKTTACFSLLVRPLGWLCAALPALLLAQPAPKFDAALLGSSYYTPLQLGSWPLKVGPESQLFVDDFLIHSMPGVVRAAHEPVKYAGNPILTADRPWEKAGDVRANGTIVFDPEAQQYRMYYDGSHLVAYSKDGITWTKPSLGLVAFNGSKDNNIVFDYDGPSDLGSFIYDPRDPDPKRRWKAAIFYYDYGENPRFAKDGGLYGERSGVYAFYSEDGLKWDGKAGQLIIPGRRGKMAGSTWPLTGVDDVTTVTWDAQLGKFAAWMKVWDLADGRYYRARAMALSDDFVHWSPPWTVLLPDKIDPPDLQFYGMTGWPYEGMWLGMLRAFHSATANQPVDLQLVTSRDGVRWARANNRAPFIPNGPDGSYDHGYHNDFTSGPIRMGDELYFYYASTAYGKAWVPSDTKTGICLAKLRVDGFASLHATSKPGDHFVITRPLDFTGRELVVNAIADKGRVLVEVLSGETADDLKPIPGFTAADGVALTGRGIEQRVTWKNHADLSALAGKRIRLKFQLEGLAGLYSFKIR